MNMPELPPPFSFKKGKLYGFICAVCKQTNGGFIASNDKEVEEEKQDPYSPVNQPCISCGQKTVVIYHD